MMRSLYTSATGMRSEQVNVDVIANNLANVNTTGYKRSQALFQDLLYERVRTPGASSGGGANLPTGIQLGLGTHLVSVAKIFTPGKPMQTGNQFDIWIEGNGFFKVTKPDGTECYTQDGAFRLNVDGQVVNADGYQLEGVDSISVEATAVAIAPDGTVSETVNGVASDKGQIKLYRFVNPAGLLAEGSNLFLPSSASGDATEGTPGEEGMGSLRQGYLEMSNVDVVTEMVNLIVAQRAYEVNTKAIQASDEMLQQANNLRR
jgi:flagellar basal-body rod protein FlgG